MSESIVGTPQGEHHNGEQTGSHDGAVRSGSGGSPPKKKHDDGLNELPEQVRSAVRAYIKTDVSCEKGLWGRAEKANTVKLACDSEREVAEKAGKSTYLTLHEVTKILGESKASFYDDLDAWQARVISDLTNKELPPKGYSSFVSLGRFLKSAKKLVKTKSDPAIPLSDADVERTIAPVTEKVKNAANQFAVGLGKQAIRELLKQKPRELLGYPPPPSDEPDPTESEMTIDDRDGIPITGDDLAKEIIARCSSPEYVGRDSVTYIKVGLPEMDGMSVAHALGHSTLHEKTVSAVKHGMDLWVCFRQTSTKKENVKESAQPKGGDQ